jgi:hypothetical protein
MNYQAGGSQSAAQYGEMKPDASALHGILRRITEVRSNLHDIHGIADRACGSSGLGESTTAPKAVPNGLLSEIEEAMDGLMSLSAEAVVRLSRVA